MRVRLLLLLALFLLAAQPARADSPAPLRDFALDSANGQYRFVMLVHADDQSAYNQNGRIVEDPALRQTYPASGLYRNDGSTTPLWTVSWNAFRVDLANDGHHLVRYGPWPTSRNYAEIPLVFYRDGRELRRYTVRDLVAEPERLPQSVSHYQWLDFAGLDAATGRLALVTRNGERYRFDPTGAILYRTWVPQPVIIAPGRGTGLLVAALLATLVYAATLGRRRRVSGP